LTGGDLTHSEERRSCVMRKIVAGLFMSLDGVLESPDRWHFPRFNDRTGQAVGAQIAEADTPSTGGR
jgi:hypothetical protein